MKKITLLIAFFFSMTLSAQELRFSNNCNVCFRAIDNRINIRTEPDTNSKILGQLWEPEIIYVNKEKSTEHWLFCYVPKIDSMAYVYAEYFKETPDYNDGNGTIIFEKKIDNQTLVIRKHKQIIKNFKYEYSYADKDISIRNNYYPNAKKIGSIKNGDNITINKVLTKEYNGKTEVWFEINTGKIEGWIFISDKNWLNPYEEYNFNSILYYKNIGGKRIPVRKMDLSGCLTRKQENLYKEPDENSEVVTQAYMTFHESEGPDGELTTVPDGYVWLHGTELIYSDSKYWIYTEFQNINGWVEFNKLSIDRGGCNINEPENIVQKFFEGI